MAQESPSRLLYAQAAQGIRQLLQIYSTQSQKSSVDLSTYLNKTITQFFDQAGFTMTIFDPVTRSEVPSSSKMNNFWTSVETDINILQDQVDLITASTIAAHNLIKTDILRAKGENLQLQNKLKTLELYSAVDNDSLIYFGDSFITEDFIDWDLVPSFDQASVADGFIMLKVMNTNTLFDSNTRVKILNTSNGFLGNNQEILDPNMAITDPSTGQKLYQFVSETGKSNDLKRMLDNKPTTWVEFEKYSISQEDRSAAKNFNFEYILSNDSTYAYLSNSKDSAITQRSSGSTISWADGITSGALRFYFEIDLNTTKQLNLLSLTPYGLVDNANNPIKVIRVSVSSDRTNWTILTPENIWIANGIDKKVITLNQETITVGSSTWVCDGLSIRFIRFEIEQPKPIECSVGHLYYVGKDSPAVNTPNYTVEIPTSNDDLLYDSERPYDSYILYGGSEAATVLNEIGSNNVTVNDVPGNLQSASYSRTLADSDYRVIGPNPSVINPQQYLSPNSTRVNGLIQKREYFKGKRWAIGIRDINAVQNSYNSVGVIVSKRFDVPGIVDRVSLEADITIPQDYSSSDTWIKFYVSPDDGLTWYRISRIQDDFINVPEIIAFNDPTPNDLREPGVGYYNVSDKVNSLRVKIEITRPDDVSLSTPTVNSYRLKIVKRNNK